jgi:hypothetical protein
MGWYGDIQNKTKKNIGKQRENFIKSSKAAANLSLNITQKSKEKMSQSKDGIKKTYASVFDMKNVTEELFFESSELLKTLIARESVNHGDIFYGFKILDNKLILSSAAYLLANSYKYLNEQNSNYNFIQKDNLNRERIFAKYANGIYSKIKPAGLIKLFKEQHIIDKESGKGIKLLIPVHGIFKNAKTKSIILAIRGTASPQDALIDGLATTKPVFLGGNKYYAHSGFLKASTFIANELAPELKKLLKENPGYTLTVTGHSLGGGTATITGVLLFDKHFNRKIPVNICGFASGSSFAAQKNGTPLEQYLKRNPTLKIVTFVYKNDIVPRLSAFEMFVFLSTCVSICKLIFLQQKLTLFPNFKLSDKERNIFLKKNPTIKSAILTSEYIGKAYKNTSQLHNELKNKGQKLSGFIYEKKKNLFGGGDIVIKLCNKIYMVVYSYFENKFKQNGDFYKLFTSHPGAVYYMNGLNIMRTNPYIFQAKFKTESLKNHLMNNYIGALSVVSVKPQTAGKRKTRKVKKYRNKRNKKTNKSRRKRL